MVNFHRWLHSSLLIELQLCILDSLCDVLFRQPVHISLTPGLVLHREHQTSLTSRGAKNCLTEDSLRVFYVVTLFTENDVV